MSSITVTPLGAGQDVGRSCLLVCIGGKRIMLDCGMYNQLFITLILFYKQRFISNDFLTSLFSKKFKQQTRLFLKN